MISPYSGRTSIISQTVWQASWRRLLGLRADVIPGGPTIRATTSRSCCGVKGFGRIWTPGSRSNGAYSGERASADMKTMRRRASGQSRRTSS